MTLQDSTSITIEIDNKNLERHLSSDDDSDSNDQMVNYGGSLDTHLNFLDSIDSDDDNNDDDKWNNLMKVQVNSNLVNSNRHSYHQLGDEFPTIRRSQRKKRRERTASISSTSSEDSCSSRDSGYSDMSGMGGYSNDWRGSAPAISDYFDHSTPEFQTSTMGRPSRSSPRKTRRNSNASETADFIRQPDGHSPGMQTPTSPLSRSPQKIRSSPGQDTLDSRLNFLDEVDLASTDEDTSQRETCKRQLDFGSSHDDSHLLPNSSDTPQESKIGSIKNLFGKVVQKLTKSTESLTGRKKSFEVLTTHLDDYAVALQLESPIKSDNSQAQVSSTDHSLNASLNFLSERELTSDDNEVSDRIDGQLHFLDSADSESNDEATPSDDRQMPDFLRQPSKYYNDENSDSSEASESGLKRANSFSVGSRRPPRSPTKSEKQGPTSPLNRSSSLRRNANPLSRSSSLPRKKPDGSPQLVDRVGSGTLARNGSFRVSSELPSRNGSLTRNSPLARSVTSPWNTGSERKSLTPQRRPSILNRFRNKDSESSSVTTVTELSVDHTPLVDDTPFTNRPRTASECSDLSAVIDVHMVTHQPSAQPPPDRPPTPPPPLLPTAKPVVLKRQVSQFLSTSSFAGIPFAILYGVFIFFFLAYWILPPPPAVQSVKQISPIQPPVINGTNNRTGAAVPVVPVDVGHDSGIYKDQNASEYCTNKWLRERSAYEEEFSKSSRTKQWWPTPSPMNIAIAASSGFTTSLVLGVTSVYSQGTRCVMVLVLPNLLSGRGRAALMTVAIGFLIDGPLASIQHNIQKVAESLTCLYRLLSQVSCRYNKIVDQAENGQPTVAPTSKTTNKRGDRQADTTQKPIINSNVNGTTIALEEIKDKIVNVVQSVEAFTELIDEIFFWLKRALLILSIILLVKDSISYYRQYYMDDRFDNMVVDRNLRKLWRRGAYPKLTPMRNWELNKTPGYKVMSKVCVSWNGVADFIRAAWPTSLFIVQALFFLFLDYGIANLLESFCKGGSYDVHFAGLKYLTMTTKDMDFMWSVDIFKIRRFLGDTELTIDLHNIDFPLSDLNEFVIQTKPCLPWPVHTDWHLRTGLVAIMLTACLTHFFDMAFSRTKNLICNLFFDGRADDRANDLYRRIESGREQRTRELSKIVLRELKRRDRKKRLSFFNSCSVELWRKFRLVRWWLEKTDDRCPGCNHKKKKTKVDDNNNNIEEVEEAKEAGTGTLKRRSRRNSIASSVASLEEAAQHQQTLDYEDGVGMRHAPSMDSIASFLQESAEVSTIKRSPKSQKKSSTGHTTKNQLKAESPTSSDEDMSRGFLATLICTDCQKDLPSDSEEKHQNGGADGMDGTLSRISLRSASMGNMNIYSDENSNSMITNQDSLEKYITRGGFWGR